MRLARIRPYPTWAAAADGSRTSLAAHGLVLERPLGVDLEVNLAPHPRSRGYVVFSTYRGSFLIEPSSGSGAYLFVEPWPRGDRRRKSDRRRGRTPLAHVYTVDARDKKTATSHRQFDIDLGKGLQLHLDLAPPAPGHTTSASRFRAGRCLSS